MGTGWVKEDAVTVVMRPELTGERIILRMLQPGDRRDRLAIGRHPKFVRMVGGDGTVVTPLTMEDVDRWYAGLGTDPYAWVIAINVSCSWTGVSRAHH